MRLLLSLLLVSLLAACASAPSGSGATSSDAGRRGSLHARRTPQAPRAYAPPAGFPRFVDQSVGTEEISIQAMSLVGVPYRWGGNTPDAGFDCSGLVRYVVARAADVELPRTTADMSQRGEEVEPDAVAPGDLIYFNTTGRPHSHVGIYVGNYRFVNAPSTGGTVRIDYVTNPYWARRFDGLRRIRRAVPSAPFDAPLIEASAPPQAPITRPAAAPSRVAAASRPPSVTSDAATPAVSIAPARTDAVAQGAAPATDPIAAAILSAAVETPASAPGTAGTAPPAADAPVPTRRADDALTAHTAAAPIVTHSNGGAPADAFEPPPPRAAQAMAQTRQTDTALESRPADDDPIARLANHAF